MTGCDKGCQSAISGFIQLLRTGCQCRQLKPIKFSVIDYVWESVISRFPEKFRLMADIRNVVSENFAPAID